MYCCFSRDLSLACSMLKDRFFDWVPLKNLTGTETSPKPMVPEQIARAAMPSAPFARQLSDHTISTPPGRVDFVL